MAINNHATKESAEHQAKIIKAFWREKGFEINLEIGTSFSFGEHGSDSYTYCIRSNMIGGKPNRDPSAPVFKKGRATLINRGNGFERLIVSHLEGVVRP